jgi:hypothetical protein
LQQLVLIRKLAGGFLRVDQAALQDDFKNAAGGWDQLDICG